MKKTLSDYNSESVSVGIRVLLAMGKTSYEIAKENGVSRATVYKLLDRTRKPSTKLYWSFCRSFTDAGLPMGVLGFLDVAQTRIKYSVWLDLKK